MKAAIRTFVRDLSQKVSYLSYSGDPKLTDTPKFLAILPRQIVVLVRIPGCSSLAVFARHLNNSPLMTLSLSLGTSVRTALTVCSLTTGAASEKPVVYNTLIVCLDK